MIMEDVETSAAEPISMSWALSQGSWLMPGEDASTREIKPENIWSKHVVLVPPPC